MIGSVLNGGVRSVSVTSAVAPWRSPVAESRASASEPAAPSREAQA
jgi:hypothetical protein